MIAPSDDTDWTLMRVLHIHTGDANSALKKRAADHPIETLDDATNKVDLINESLAFTIENTQVCHGRLKRWSLISKSR